MTGVTCCRGWNPTQQCFLEVFVNYRDGVVKITSKRRDVAFMTGAVFAIGFILHKTEKSNIRCESWFFFSDLENALSHASLQYVKTARVERLTKLLILYHERNAEWKSICSFSDENSQQCTPPTSSQRGTSSLIWVTSFACRIRRHATDNYRNRDIACSSSRISINWQTTSSSFVSTVQSWPSTRPS